MNAEILRKNLGRLSKQKNFRQLFELIIENGDRCFSLFVGRETSSSLSYKELSQLVESCSQQLQHYRTNANHHQVLGLCWPNSPEWVILFFSALKSGFNVLLLDPTFSEENILRYLDQVGAKVLLLPSSKVQRQDITILNYKELIQGQGKTENNNVGHSSETPWGQEIFICSSGSTGLSKICVHTESSFLDGLINGLCKGGATKSKDVNKDQARVLALAPFSLMSGLSGTLIFYLLCGKTLVFPQDLSPLFIRELCQREKITTTFAVDSVLRAIISNIEKNLQQQSGWKRLSFFVMRQLSLLLQLTLGEKGRWFAFTLLFKGLHQKLLGSALETIACGGSSISPKVLRYINSLGIITMNGYGMTETGVISVETSNSLLKRVSGSVGLPNPQLPWKIVPLAGMGSDEGEICLRGEQLCKGHWEKGAFRPLELDTEGYYHTGDLGKIQRGCLQITGRLKDLIVLSNGKKVIPNELEAKIKSLCQSQDLCVLGIKNKQGDEEVSAIFSLGEQFESGEIHRQIKESILLVNKGLPLYQRVKNIFLMNDSLPVTSSKKIQTFKLKHTLEQFETKGAHKLLKL